MVLISVIPFAVAVTTITPVDPLEIGMLSPDDVQLSIVPIASSPVRPGLRSHDAPGTAVMVESPAAEV